MKKDILKVSGLLIFSEPMAEWAATHPMTCIVIGVIGFGALLCWAILTANQIRNHE